MTQQNIEILIQFTIYLLFQVYHKKLDLSEYQGEPQDIARFKCKEAAKEFPDETLLIEDTSLCFTAFNSLPGPYIKWFLEKMGTSGKQEPASEQKYDMRQ